LLIVPVCLLLIAFTISFAFFVLGNDPLKNVSVISVVASVEDPPIYPGAQQINKVSSEVCHRETTFTTDDTNDQISAFYDDFFSRNGWAISDRPYYGLQYSSPFGNQVVITFVGYSKKQVRLAVFCSGITYPAATTASLTPAPSLINITRQQYEEALAKWQAADVEEYEITVAHFGMFSSINKLRVTDHGTKVTVLEDSMSAWGGTPPPITKSEDPDSVEGMFAYVEGIIENNTESHVNAAMEKDHYYIAHEVELDPDLGYPVRISYFAVTAPFTSVFDANGSQIVAELRILKRAQPRPNH
jgi:hypothetical protein